MHRSLLRRANVGYGGPRAAYDGCVGRISDFCAKTKMGALLTLTQAHEQTSRGWLCLDGSAAGQHASGIDMRVRAR